MLAETIADMRTPPEPAVITLGQVFKCCGAKFQCANCERIEIENYCLLQAGGEIEE